jgi:hypothetical protein
MGLSCYILCITLHVHDYKAQDPLNTAMLVSLKRNDLGLCSVRVACPEDTGSRPFGAIAYGRATHNA